MVTLIIAVIAVAVLSFLLRGMGKLGGMAREEELKQKALREHMPHILELEAMGFRVEALDEETERALEKGRANRAALLPKNITPCTIEESIADCYADPGALQSAKNIVAGIEAYCNVRFYPDIDAAVARYAKDIEQRQAEE